MMVALVMVLLPVVDVDRAKRSRMGDGFAAGERGGSGFD